jgi:hypothetical protein
MAVELSLDGNAAKLTTKVNDTSLRKGGGWWTRRAWRKRAGTGAKVETLPPRGRYFRESQARGVSPARRDERSASRYHRLRDK